MLFHEPLNTQHVFIERFTQTPVIISRPNEVRGGGVPSLILLCETHVNRYKVFSVKVNV